MFVWAMGIQEPRWPRASKTLCTPLFVIVKCEAFSKPRILLTVN